MIYAEPGSGDVEPGSSNALSTCSSTCSKQCSSNALSTSTDGTDVTENLVQVDRSSLDLIARREIQSDFSTGFDPKQSTDRTL